MDTDTGRDVDGNGGGTNGGRFALLATSYICRNDLFCCFTFYDMYDVYVENAFLEGALLACFGAR